MTILNCSYFVYIFLTASLLISEHNILAFRLKIYPLVRINKGKFLKVVVVDIDNPR